MKLLFIKLKPSIVICSMFSLIVGCREVEIPETTQYPDIYINLLHSGTTENLRSAHFFNADTGIVVSTLGSILKTKNGGLTWVKSNPIVPTTTDTIVVFNRLYFQNETTGWILGTLNAKNATGTGTTAKKTLLLKTIDGGITWENLDFDQTVKTFTRIAFFDDLNGYVIGSAGLIYHTIDGGTTWIKQESGVTSSLTDISIQGINNAYICGTNGVFLSTADAGTTWAPIVSPAKRAFKSMNFLSPNQGFITGGGSNNGGPNDDKQFIYQIDGNGNYTDLSITAYSLFYFNDIVAHDQDNIWVAGHLGQIYRTIDGGKTWSDELSKSMRQEHLYDICFANHRIGYFVGDGGIILKVDLDKL